MFNSDQIINKFKKKMSLNICFRCGRSTSDYYQFFNSSNIIICSSCIKENKCCHVTEVAEPNKHSKITTFGISSAKSIMVIKRILCHQILEGKINQGQLYSDATLFYCANHIAKIQSEEKYSDALEKAQTIIDQEVRTIASQITDNEVPVYVTRVLNDLKNEKRHLQ